MGSTNKTANLELSQFLGSDSPKWLTDYNADMQKIDTAVGAVKSQADATDLVVSGHTTAIETLQTATGEQGTAIENLRSDVNHNAGDISTINSLIGNGEPTTTDKTIIGAINELHGITNDLNDEIGAVTSALSGKKVYSEQRSVTVTADGSETLGNVLKRLQAAANEILHNLDDGVRFIPLDIYTPLYFNIPSRISGLTLSKTQNVIIDNSLSFILNGDIIVRQISANSDANYAYAASAVNGTVTDDTNSVPAIGDAFIFEYRLEYPA